MHSLEYGGFGKRPGFGLNTYKASIKLTLFFAIFLDPYYSVKTGGKAKGQEGTVFFRTTLTPFPTTQFEDIQPTLLPSLHVGAMTAAEEDGLPYRSVRYFCQFFRALGNTLKGMGASLLRWLRILPKRALRSESSRTAPTTKRKLVGCRQVSLAISRSSPRFCKLTGLQRWT